jgi:hypothetical protein
MYIEYIIIILEIFTLSCGFMIIYKEYKKRNRIIVHTIIPYRISNIILPIQYDMNIIDERTTVGTETSI